MQASVTQKNESKRRWDYGECGNERDVRAAGWGRKGTVASPEGGRATIASAGFLAGVQ